MENFLITAMGRSGTKFLASMMNRSKTWTVKHEYPDMGDFNLNIKEIQRRFNKEHYGEVNGNLRDVADVIDVGLRGVILRDPAEIWISIAHRRNPGQWKEALDSLDDGIKRILVLSESPDFLPIGFKEMTTDKIYLQAILRYFGIFGKEVKVTQGIINNPINATQKRRYFTMKDFDKAIQERVECMRKMLNFK